MVIEKKLYQVTIDELPVIGGFVYNSFMGDAGDFVPYTDFADPFPTNYANKLKEVELAVSPVIIRNKMKVVTFTLLTDMYGLRDKLNKAEIYFNSAGSGLDVKPEDMGQHEVRVEIGRGDVEAVIGALKTMNQNIYNNKALLATKGMTVAMQTDLVTVATNLKTNNDSQNAMIQERANSTKTNMTLYNDFWILYLALVAKTGRLIYKAGNATKAKNYTISQLKARIRHDAAQTEVYGVVKDGANNVVKDAKVKLIPVMGGRTKTVKTDVNGKFSVSGMKATDYNMVVTKGALVKVVAVTVVTRVHLEVNVVIA